MLYVELDVIELLRLDELLGSTALLLATTENNELEGLGIPGGEAIEGSDDIVVKITLDATVVDVGTDTDADGEKVQKLDVSAVIVDFLTELLTTEDGLLAPDDE